MRHLKKNKKFGKKRDQRQAFIIGLLSNLIQKESIITTPTRAKVVKAIIDRFITKAKSRNLAALRYLISHNLPPKSAFKLYHELVPKLDTRKSGYTRISKMGQFRKRDGAEKVRLEIIH